MRLKDEIKFDKIYIATLKQTVQVGLAGITMASIAQAAGIATGTLYTYYENKADLIHATYKQTLAVYGRQLFRGVAQDMPVKLGVKLAFSNYLNFLKDHHDEWIFQDQYFTSPYATSNKDTEITALQMLSPLSALLDRGRQELLIKNIPETYFFSMLLGFGHELAIAVRLGANHFDQSMMDIAFQMYWDAIKS